MNPAAPISPLLRAPEWPAEIAPSRFASTIRTADPEGCQIALIGLPDDTGVSLNNGRLGARQGPTSLRRALATTGAADPHGWRWPRVFDAGDVRTAPGDLHATHEAVTEAVAAVVAAGLLPVAIGGGHDLTFPFVRAVAAGVGPMHGVYYDPHLDVRETDGSGMAFRRLLETGAAASLELHGYDPMVNSRAHTEWFLASGGRTAGDARARFRDPAFVSFDLDLIDAAHAPGVSAPNPAGWAPAALFDAAERAGRDAAVRCADVMELSPPNDAHDRTARVAARLVLSFLRGFSERDT